MSVFKKFFEDMSHDLAHHTSSAAAKPKYSGTIEAYPHFDAPTDVTVLHNAIEHEDDDMVSSLLLKRSNEQRQVIRVLYEATIGERLDDDLKDICSDLQDVCRGLVATPAEYDAFWFKNATEGMGTDEHVLVEILATRSSEELHEVKKVYKEVYDDDLEDVIKCETSGDFKDALVAMLDSHRDMSMEIDMALLERDSEILFESGDEADVHAIMHILTSRSPAHLAKTFERYAAYHDVKLPKASDLDLSRDMEDCLLAIVKCAWNMPAYFAEKLHVALKDHFCKATLNRILVSRSEVDLKKILEQYRAMYHKGIQEDIASETSGRYQSILLGLCGPY